MEEDGEEIIREIVIAREVVLFVIIWMQCAMCSAPIVCDLLIIGWLKIKWEIILPRRENKTERVKQRTLFLTFRPFCKGGKLDFIVGEWWVSIIEICLFLPSPREMRGAIAAHNSSCFVIAHVSQDTLVQHKSSSSAQIPAPVWPQTSQYFSFFPLSSPLGPQLQFSWSLLYLDPPWTIFFAFLCSPRRSFTHLLFFNDGCSFAV